MCCAPPKCKLLSQDCTTSIECDTGLGVTNASSFHSPGQLRNERCYPRTFRVRVAHDILKYLFRRSNILLKFTVLQYAQFCRMVARLEVYYSNRLEVLIVCLRSISRIDGSDRLSNVQVKNLVLVADFEDILSQGARLSGLCWLDYALRIANARPPYRILSQIGRSDVEVGK